MIREVIDEIIKEARKGKITINSNDGDWNFFAKFYVNELNCDYPSIKINDYEKFEDDIKGYLDYAYDFYYKDKEFYDLDDKGYIKKLIFDLLVNTTYFDCDDIYNYIDRKIKILKDTTIKEGIINGNSYLGLETEIMIKKNNSNLEGPYQFIIRFKDSDNNVFELPQVTFGVIEGKVYLMCIQNKNKEINTLVKKMDRYFRKVNKDVDMETDLGLVSPRALVTLTVFNSYMKSLNLDEVIIPSYLPIRYNSKVIKNEFKIKDNESREKASEELDKIQFNVTNKMMYLIQRYVYHFTSCNCDYDGIKDEMNLQLSNSNEGENNIIYDFDKLLSKKKLNR